MKFKRADVITGIIIIVLVIAGYLIYKNANSGQNETAPTPTNLKKEIVDKFRYDIPDDVSYSEFKDLTGTDLRGILTNQEILIDASDPESGSFYQAWVEKNGKFVSLGKLKALKGGWLLEFDGQKFEDYDKVVISQERVFDGTMEKRMMEALLPKE